MFPTFYSNECFPLVILEAMEYGLPVVSTNEGGIQDIILDGKTGYVVEKHNPAALATALEHLINDPGLRTRMGNAGRKRFEEAFTEEVFEKRISECLAIQCNKLG